MLLAHTPKKRRRRGAGAKRERNGVSTEEKIDGTKEEGRGEKTKRENRKEEGARTPSEIRRHTTQTSSAGRDPLCHVSVRQLVRK